MKRRLGLSVLRGAWGGLRPTRGEEEGTAGIAPLLSRDLGRELLDGRSV